ncbi:hypothetical protein CK203_086146 [Vitis vinifera]|uniref:Uncharacterized protein n=1 Tax=Vitis vinifera TaxID=29760 RepID=A0A438CT89_VITVI|nr:hypothetical protein CK203_086146 [Vitis vinifera]
MTKEWRGAQDQADFNPRTGSSVWEPPKKALLLLAPHWTILIEKASSQGDGQLVMDTASPPCSPIPAASKSSSQSHQLF